jgi:hypothetical protein
MTPKFSLITAVAGAALAIAAPAWADSWAADRQQTPVTISPDAVDRAVAAKQRETAAMLDTRETALLRRSQPSSQVSPYPDVVDRAIAARPTTIYTPVVDDPIRHDPTTGVVCSPAGSPSTGTTIEWPQVGAGIGFGLLLALGLFVGVRLVHHRELAH